MGEDCSNGQAVMSAPAPFGSLNAVGEEVEEGGPCIKCEVTGGGQDFRSSAWLIGIVGQLKPD